MNLLKKGSDQSWRYKNFLRENYCQNCGYPKHKCECKEKD